MASTSGRFLLLIIPLMCHHIGEVSEVLNGKATKTFSFVAFFVVSTLRL